MDYDVIIIDGLPYFVPKGDGPDLPPIGPITYWVMMVTLSAFIGWEFYVIFF